VIDHLSYGSFGDILSESSPANGDKFKFDGMQYDDALGIYYVNARWYDPASGRFVSKDPTGFGAGDQNLSRFTSNSPVNHTDPSGLDAAGGFGGALAGGITGLGVGLFTGGWPGGIVGGITGLIGGGIYGYQSCDGFDEGASSGVVIGFGAGLIGGLIGPWIGPNGTILASEWLEVWIQRMIVRGFFSVVVFSSIGDLGGGVAVAAGAASNSPANEGNGVPGNGGGLPNHGVRPYDGVITPPLPTPYPYPSPTQPLPAPAYFPLPMPYPDSPQTET
jgi:RHS repeat-associated protein